MKQYLDGFWNVRRREDGARGRRVWRREEEEEDRDLWMGESDGMTKLLTLAAIASKHVACASMFFLYV